MSIGGGIFLLVIGAILAFAVKITVVGIDLQLVGYILMAAGLVILILGIALLFRRRRGETTVLTEVDPVTGQRVVRREVDEDGSGL